MTSQSEIQRAQPTSAVQAPVIRGPTSRGRGWGARRVQLLQPRSTLRQYRTRVHGECGQFIRGRNIATSTWSNQTRSTHLSTPKPHFGDPHALRLAVCFLTTSKASHFVGLTRLIDTRFRYNRELFQPSIRQCLNSTIATCGHSEELPGYDLQPRCQLICVP